MLTGEHGAVTKLLTVSRRPDCARVRTLRGAPGVSSGAAPARYSACFRPGSMLEQFVQPLARQRRTST
jgi:hypothetical protein